MGFPLARLCALKAGDGLLADALYANYWLIAELAAAGVDVVLRQHGSRKSDFRRGQRLGPRDPLVHWPRPAHKPQWMSRAQYRAVPQQLTLRDPRAVSKAQLGKLYQRLGYLPNPARD